MNDNNCIYDEHIRYNETEKENIKNTIPGKENEINTIMLDKEYNNSIIENKENISSKSSSYDMYDSYSISSNGSSDSNLSSDMNEFNFFSSSEECSECEYNTLCLHNSSNINSYSVYKFLKKDNSILFVNNCNVKIKGGEGIIKEYHLKGYKRNKNMNIKNMHSRNKNKKYNRKTKLIPLKINDMEYKYIVNENNDIFISEPFFSIKSKYLEKILLQEGYYKFEENEMNEIQYVNERITKGNTYVNTKDIITSFNSNEKKGSKHLL